MRTLLAALRLSARLREFILYFVVLELVFPCQVRANVSRVLATQPETEMVSCDHAVRTCGLPALAIWQRALPHVPSVYFHEDNMAMIQVLETG